MYLVCLAYAQELFIPKKISLKNDLFSLNYLYDYAPAQEPGAMNITILVDVSLVTINIYTQFEDLCTDVKKRMYKNTPNSHFIPPNNLFSVWGVDHENYNILSPYFVDATNLRLAK